MKKLTQEEFIERAVNVHGDKYSYELVEYTNNSTKVKITCLVHGVFEQSPNKHMGGQGCPMCSVGIVASTKRKVFDDFLKESVSVHGDKYSYELVDYKNRNTKIKIICPVHGIFKQRPANHLMGWGCNDCGYDTTKRKVMLDHDVIIERAKQVHGDKYSYELVEYTKKKDVISIICPDHGVFEQRSENHLYGQGCPKCSCVISRQELELQEWLSDFIDIKTNDRSLIKPYELDIVIPSKNIAIEYNGLYWHSEGAGRDNKYHLNKHNMCKEKGYRLIQIWENEWLLKKAIIKSMILSSINIHDTKIHGRKCTIKSTSPQDSRIFYNSSHIQGFQGGIHHGLYYNDELVSLMSIKTYKDYYMLERFVNRKNTLVHGAFTKLLMSFNFDMDVITFADVRHFSGGVYENNGFRYIHTTKPNYWYFKNSTIDITHRRSFQKKKIKERCDNGSMIYDGMLTEYENMVNNKYHRIWDCGNIKFILDTKKP